MPDITRRNLVAATAASLIGTSGWAGANDRIRIAILGLGGRGGDHLKLAAQVPGVEVATFCDPDETQFSDSECRELLHAGRVKYAYCFVALSLGLAAGDRRGWKAP